MKNSLTAMRKRGDTRIIRQAAAASKAPRRPIVRPSLAAMRGRPARPAAERSAPAKLAARSPAAPGTIGAVMQAGAKRRDPAVREALVQAAGRPDRLGSLLRSLVSVEALAAALRRAAA